MNWYKSLLSPLLNLCEPETTHNMTVALLSTLERCPGGLAILKKCSGSSISLDDSRLNISIGSLQFDSPITLAAGWDKNGICLEALRTLGFSSIEIGGVTLHAQPGHPKPRIFRVAPGVLINHCGFFNSGAENVAENLLRYTIRNFPIGINLGLNKDVSATDAITHFSKLSTMVSPRVDYCVLNVSSPNTPGLRALQNKSFLIDIIEALPRSKPLFIKISPDLSFEALDDIIDIALKYHLLGIVATNSTTNPEIQSPYQLRYGKRSIKGGLSGNNPHYRVLANALSKHIYHRAGSQLLIIGCGGIDSTEAVLERITSGATLVQIMTGFATEGPCIANRIKKELIAFLDSRKIQHLSECIGKPEYLE